MSERLRTILAVTVLTLAIWVWADLEQTAPPREVQVPVRVVLPPDYMAKTLSPTEVTVMFQGPKGEVEKLAASAEEMVCRLEPTDQELKNAPAGRLVLHAADGFKHWPRRIVITDILADHAGASTSDIVVQLDHMMKVRVDVKVAVTGAVATVAMAQPAEVEARVAESDWNRLAESKRFAVAPLVVSTLPPGGQIVQEVSLEPRLGGPDGIKASFDPPIVKVTAKLESALVTRTLKGLPVRVGAMPESLNRYQIVFQPGAQLTVDLEVQGPAPDVERLEPGNLYVLLELSAEDKPEPDSWLPGKPKVIGLPPNVKLVRPLPTINFNLVKIGEKPPTP
jgi:hypothetical protein